jgi:hypothetical protein
MERLLSIIRLSVTPPPSYLYTAFGLTIASDVELPELLPGDGAPDITIAFGEVDVAPLQGDAWTIDAGEHETRGWAPRAGAFLVRNGSEIVVAPVAGFDDRALRMSIVGPLLGVILAQRGRFVLHASTVMIGDVAVAFAGPSGRGKSTLAGALTQAGHRLIADDITVIDTSGEFPVVDPGFPRVKLWPDSADALDHDLDALPLIHPDRSKRSVQFTDRFQPEPVRLKRCYLLEEGDTESSEPLGGQETILALIRSTYQASWLHQTGVSGANLLHCGALARSGVVRRLRRRRTYAALGDVIAFIERDVRS